MLPPGVAVGFTINGPTRRSRVGWSVAYRVLLAPSHQRTRNLGYTFIRPGRISELHARHRRLTLSGTAPRAQNGGEVRNTTTTTPSAASWVPRIKTFCRIGSWRGSLAGRARHSSKSRATCGGRTSTIPSSSSGLLRPPNDCGGLLLLPARASCRSLFVLSPAPCCLALGARRLARGESFVPPPSCLPACALGCEQPR